MEHFRMWSGHFHSHLFFQQPNAVHWACLLQLTLLWKFSWNQLWCGLGAAKKQRIRNSWVQKSQTTKMREAAKSVFVHFVFSQIEGIRFWRNVYEQYLPTSVNSKQIWVSFSVLSVLPICHAASLLLFFKDSPEDSADPSTHQITLRPLQICTE